jgi:Holliday junction resolvasome RuvABC ATP-dependent DNA helicase subunit
MNLVLRYEFYSDEELSQITRHRGRALNWDMQCQRKKPV